MSQDVPDDVKQSLTVDPRDALQPPRRRDPGLVLLEGLDDLRVDGGELVGQGRDERFHPRAHRRDDDRPLLQRVQLVPHLALSG